MKPSILIVEDEESIRKGLCDLFVYHGFSVDWAADGREGLKKSLSGKYHLLILDIMLPELSGLQICNEVRKVDRSQPIILLTAKGDEEDIIKGLKLGADDYVPKPFSVRELVARAEAVLRRSQKLQAETQKVTWGDCVIDPQNLTGRFHGSDVELTRREVEILHYLVDHSDRPVSRKELLKEVWGYGNTTMDTRTVDIHIAKLRKKIEQDPEEPSLILTVRGEGYKMGRAGR